MKKFNKYLLLLWIHAVFMAQSQAKCDPDNPSSSRKDIKGGGGGYTNTACENEINLEIKNILKKHNGVQLLEDVNKILQNLKKSETNLEYKNYKNFSDGDLKHDSKTNTTFLNKLRNVMDNQQDSPLLKQRVESFIADVITMCSRYFGANSVSEVQTAAKQAEQKGNFQTPVKTSQTEASTQTTASQTEASTQTTDDFKTEDEKKKKEKEQEEKSKIPLQIIQTEAFIETTNVVRFDIEVQSDELKSALKRIEDLKAEIKELQNQPQLTQKNSDDLLNVQKALQEELEYYKQNLKVFQANVGTLEETVTQLKSENEALKKLESENEALKKQAESLEGLLKEREKQYEGQYKNGEHLKAQYQTLWNNNQKLQEQAEMLHEAYEKNQETIKSYENALQSTKEVVYALTQKNNLNEERIAENIKLIDALQQVLAASNMEIEKITQQNKRDDPFIQAIIDSVVQEGGDGAEQLTKLITEQKSTIENKVRKILQRIENNKLIKRKIKHRNSTTKKSPNQDLKAKNARLIEKANTLENYRSNMDVAYQALESSLQNKSSELESAIDQITQEKSKTQTEKQELKATLLKKSQKVKNLQRQLKNARKHQERADQKLAVLKEENRMQKAQFIHLTQDIESLQKTIKNAAQNKEQVDDLKNQLIEKQKNLTALEEQFLAQVNASTTRIETLEQEAKTLIQKEAETVDKITTIQNHLEQALNREGNLTETHKEDTKTIQTLKVNMKNLEDELLALQTKNQQIQNEKDLELTQFKAQSEQVNLANQTQIEELKQQLKQQLDQNKEKEEKLNKKILKIKQRKEQISDLEKTLKETQEKNQQLITDIDTLKEQITEKERKRDKKSQEEVESLRNQLATKEEELKQSQSQSKQFEEKTSKLMHTVEQLQKSQQELMTRFEQVQNNLNQADNTIQDLKAQLETSTLQQVEKNALEVKLNQVLQEKSQLELTKSQLQENLIQLQVTSQSQQESMSKTINTLNTQLTTTSEKDTQSQKEIRNLQSKIEQLRNDLKNQTDETYKLTQDNLTALEEKFLAQVNASITRIETLEQEAKTLIQKEAETVDKITTIQNQLEQALNREGNLTETHKEDTKTIQTLKVNLKNLEDELLALQTKNQQIQNEKDLELTQFKAQSEQVNLANQTQIEELKQQLKQQLDQNKEVKEKLKKKILKIKQRKEQISDLEKTLKETQEKNQQLITDIDTLKEQITEKERKRDKKSQEEVESLRNQLATKEEELKQSQSQSKQFEEKTSKLMHTVEQLQKSQQELMTRFEQVQNNLNQADNTIQDLKAQLETSTLQQVEKNALEVKLNQVLQEKSQLELTKSQLQENLIQLQVTSQSQQESMSKTINTLNTQLTTTSEKDTQSQKEIRNLQSKIEQLRNDLKNQTDETYKLTQDELKAVKDQQIVTRYLKNQLMSSEEEVKTLKETVEILKRSETDLLNSEQKIKRDLEKTENHIIDLKDKLGASINQNAQDKLTQQSLQSELNKASEDINILKSQEMEIKRQFQELAVLTQQQKEKMSQEIEKLKNQLSQAKIEKDVESQKKIQELQQKLEESQQKLQNRENELNQANVRMAQQQQRILYQDEQKSTLDQNVQTLQNQIETLKTSHGIDSQTKENRIQELEKEKDRLTKEKEEIQKSIAMLKTIEMLNAEKNYSFQQLQNYWSQTAQPARSISSVSEHLVYLFACLRLIVKHSNEENTSMVRKRIEEKYKQLLEMIEKVTGFPEETLVNIPSLEWEKLKELDKGLVEGLQKRYLQWIEKANGRTYPVQSAGMKVNPRSFEETNEKELSIQEYDQRIISLVNSLSHSGKQSDNAASVKQRLLQTYTGLLEGESIRQKTVNDVLTFHRQLVDTVKQFGYLDLADQLDKKNLLFKYFQRNQLSPREYDQRITHLVQVLLHSDKQFDTVDTDLVAQYLLPIYTRLLEEESIREVPVHNVLTFHRQNVDPLKQFGYLDLADKLENLLLKYFQRTLGDTPEKLENQVYALLPFIEQPQTDSNSYIPTWKKIALETLEALLKYDENHYPKYRYQRLIDTMTAKKNFADLIQQFNNIFRTVRGKQEQKGSNQNQNPQPELHEQNKTNLMKTEEKIRKQEPILAKSDMTETIKPSNQNQNPQPELHGQNKTNLMKTEEKIREQEPVLAKSDVTETIKPLSQTQQKISSQPTIQQGSQQRRQVPYPEKSDLESNLRELFVKIQNPWASTPHKIDLLIHFMGEYASNVSEMTLGTLHDLVQKEYTKAKNKGERASVSKVQNYFKTYTTLRLQEIDALYAKDIDKDEFSKDKEKANRLIDLMVKLDDFGLFGTEEFTSVQNFLLADCKNALDKRNIGLFNEIGFRLGRDKLNSAKTQLDDIFVKYLSSSIPDKFPPRESVELLGTAISYLGSKFTFPLDKQRLQDAIKNSYSMTLVKDRYADSNDKYDTAKYDTFMKAIEDNRLLFTEQQIFNIKEMHKDHTIAIKEMHKIKEMLEMQKELKKKA